MMTVQDIKNIYDPDMDVPDDNIQAFIDGAGIMADNVFSRVTINIDLKEEITKYLAAHLLAVTIERFAEREGAGGAEIKYVGTFGSGLDASPYGQMAIVMDITGTLRKLGKKIAKTYAVITPDYSKQ